MAKLKVFAVHDSKALAFGNPFLQRTAGEALRGWDEAVNDPKTQMHKYPGDYTLFEIAEYDEATGRMAPYESLKSLSTAVEVKRDENPQALRQVN